MADDDTKKEVAALKAEVEALKSALSGKEDKPPKSTFVPMTDAEHMSRVHAMRERQANSWMPPSAVQAMIAAEPKGFMAGVVRDNRAPGPGNQSAIPTQATVRESSPVRESGGTAGWVEPRPLTNPPGTNWVDAIAIADDVRQRAELKRKLGGG
jgi:hypothetical protein